MSEEKKDAFTFSDKIKSSKPAFNPFSKRPSSKIGSNGKPKKTIFERTRRDAPFFIAALLALLLLPFLYRYSGTVEDDAFVIPGSMGEDYTERFDYDPSMSSDEVMQLAGRDPMSLIKGWGNGEEESEESSSSYSFDRDSIDDEYGPSTSVHTVSKSYRRNAPGAARAAFRRAPTKINELRGASLNARGGGGLGSRFGGANLRAAAKRDSAGGPKRGTKPVSLQPLRAAGSPSRSYFGQGGASQARASRDAMGKDNAAQALKDAMFAPIENRRLGGLGEGLFASGGGPGKFDRRMDFKGITPWWWDMMKDREQKKWEWEYFLWRRNFIEPIIKKLGEMIGEFIFGMGCCLLTGEDDCSMGSMWGSSATGEEPGGCKIAGSKVTTFEEYCTEERKNNDPFGLCAGDAKTFKNRCKSYVDRHERKWEWSDGHGAGGDLGFWGKRAWCMGNTFKYKGYGARDQYNCQLLNSDHVFKVVKEGKAAKWKYVYHAVIVKDELDGHVLCNAKNYKDRTPTVAGADTEDVQASRRNKGKHTDTRTETPDGVKKTHTFNDGTGLTQITAQSKYQGCVIYVAKGATFDYAKYVKEATAALVQTGYPADAFYRMQPLFIEGYVMQKPMGTAVNGNWVTTLPTLKNMPLRYIDFMNEFVENRTGAFGMQKERNNSKLAGGLATTECAWLGFGITALPINALGHRSVAGVLNYQADLYKQKDLCVKAEVMGSDLVFKNIQDVEANERASSATYYLSDAEVARIADYIKQQSTDTAQALSLDVKWTAYECNHENRFAFDIATYQTDVAPVQVEITPDACQSGQTQDAGKDENGCELFQQCVQEEGHWVWGEPQKKDPNCGAEVVTRRKIVPIKGRIPEIPGFGDCVELDKISNKQLIFADADIKALLAQAKSLYDQGQTDEELVYSEDCITIANTVDALRIVAENNGSGAVPINAVCMLGKSIGANSHDPHIKPSLDYNNMFGTFAAYMGVDSGYFPTEYITKDGNMELDPRFYWCAVPASVKAKQDGSHIPYHYGNYVWTSTHGPVPGFKNDLNNGVWAGAPLKPIADAIGWRPGAVNTNADIKANRKGYHNSYAKVFGDSSCGLSGTMPYANVLKYLKALCREGSLNAKPQNGRNACGSMGPGTGDRNSRGGNLGSTNPCDTGDC